MKGLFITFEGGEGAGKSTQIQLLAKYLTSKGLDAVVTREPGGSPGAEAVRHVLLSGAAEPFGSALEAMLFASARNDHVEQVIRPAKQAGKIVLCDRFIDSSRVYQGTTGNLDDSLMCSIERIAINGMKPDLTIILDLPAEEGLRRAHARRGSDKPDRFEKEARETHQIRREAFLRIAQEEPERCKVVDASRDVDAISQDISAIVDEYLRVTNSDATARHEGQR